MSSGEQDSSNLNKENIFGAQSRKHGESLFGIPSKKLNEPLFGQLEGSKQDDITGTHTKPEGEWERFKRQSDELLRRIYGRSFEELSGQSWESFSNNSRKSRE